MQFAGLEDGVGIQQFITAAMHMLDNLAGLDNVGLHCISAARHLVGELQGHKVRIGPHFIIAARQILGGLTGLCKLIGVDFISAAKYMVRGLARPKTGALCALQHVLKSDTVWRLTHGGQRVSSCWVTNDLKLTCNVVLAYMLELCVPYSCQARAQALLMGGDLAGRAVIVTTVASKCNTHDTGGVTMADTNSPHITGKPRKLSTR